MKKLFIIANWKSFKTISQVEDWFSQMANGKWQMDNEKTVIVCAPYILLPKVKELLAKTQLPIAAGAQDISPFDEGAYTGAVNAKQVKEFADYVIIGHSERREHFAETDEILSQKVQKALQQSITPIFCVQGTETPIPDKVTLVAYEPVWAIGSGRPETPENANAVAKTIKEKHPAVQYVLYGGSVSPDNIHDFTQMEHISGGLIGGASLDAEKFKKIITNS